MSFTITIKDGCGEKFLKSINRASKYIENSDVFKSTFERISSNGNVFYVGSGSSPTVVIKEKVVSNKLSTRCCARVRGSNKSKVKIDSTVEDYCISNNIKVSEFIELNTDYSSDDMLSKGTIVSLNCIGSRCTSKACIENVVSDNVHCCASHYKKWSKVSSLIDDIDVTHAHKVEDTDSTTRTKFVSWFGLSCDDECEIDYSMIDRENFWVLINKTTKTNKKTKVDKVRCGCRSSGGGKTIKVDISVTDYCEHMQVDIEQFKCRNIKISELDTLMAGTKVTVEGIGSRCESNSKDNCKIDGVPCCGRCFKKWNSVVAFDCEVCSNIPYKLPTSKNVSFSGMAINADGTLIPKVDSDTYAWKYYTKKDTVVDSDSCSISDDDSIFTVEPGDDTYVGSVTVEGTTSIHASEDDSDVVEGTNIPVDDAIFYALDSDSDSDSDSDDESCDDKEDAF